MRFIWGILPSQENREELSAVTHEIRKLAQSQGIPITFVDQALLYIEVVDWPGGISRFKTFYGTRILRKFRFPRFVLTLNHVRVGISRKDRTMVYMPVDEGAEFMRELLEQLAHKFKIKRNKIFIPHIAIGRVSKDMSEQEEQNLKGSIHLLCQERQFKIEIKPTQLSLITKDQEFRVAKNFDTFSQA